MKTQEYLCLSENRQQMIRHYVNIVTESLRQLKLKAEGSLQTSLKERINIYTCTFYRISNHISRGVSVDVNCLLNPLQHNYDNFFQA